MAEAWLSGSSWALAHTWRDVARSVLCSTHRCDHVEPYNKNIHVDQDLFRDFGDRQVYPKP